MKNKYFNLSILISIFLIIFSSFFKVKDVYANTTFTTCTLTEGSYLRSTPGGDKLTDVDNSTFLLYEPKRLEVIETKTVNGKEYKKLKTNYYSNNYEGWIWSGYLKDFRTYTTDDNYANSLKNKGFPDSYILPLTKLHAVYPNWNFEVSKYGSGLNWNDVINGEYNPVYKNLISGPNESLRSTDGAAYNAGTYTQFEPGWYAPSKQTIAFYMDPRNWLYDNTIFMFEQLSYNSKLHTSNAVQQILNGTFMQGSYEYNGKQWTYADTFIEAGKQRNVSPIQLASRVIQEQGTTGSATINMQSDGKTYYNHFNINAYGSDTATIVSNALKTAKAQGWTNPYLSILGGSATISNGYINIGQDTIYYQKFNTINSSDVSLYLHQYMANVRVLPSEANTTYNSYYKTGLINSSFTFKIPVYNNMPDKTTLSINNNADNTLKSLSVKECSLNPSFNSAATDYTCNVSNNINQVTISATKSSQYSSLKGDGVIKLNSSSTIANIVVTAANGEEKIYKITINKVEPGKESPADIISYLGYNNSNNVVTGISLGTNRANIISNVKNKFNLASITIKDKNGNAKEDGIISTADQIIISINGKTTTFTVAIKGDANGDGKISTIDYAKSKNYILGVNNNLSGIYFSSLDINSDGKISTIDYAKIKKYILGDTSIIK